MDEDKLEDIKYRMNGLRFEINYLSGDESHYEGWEEGYRDGRLMQMESELRFLERLIK